jgi:hypothetical protein
MSGVPSFNDITKGYESPTLCDILVAKNALSYWLPGTNANTATCTNHNSRVYRYWLDLEFYEWEFYYRNLFTFESS